MPITLDSIPNVDYSIPRKGDTDMLYTNPGVLLQIVAVTAPGVATILVEVEGLETRLAIEGGGGITARGRGLNYREHVAWAASEFRTNDPRTVLAVLKRKLRRVWVQIAPAEDDEEGRVEEFPTWQAFVTWVGKPSDMLDKISWHSCHPLNIYIPMFLNAAVDDMAAARKISKREIVVEALERHLDGWK